MSATDLLVEEIATKVAEKLQGKIAQPEEKQRLLTIQQAAEYMACSTVDLTSKAAAGHVQVFSWPGEDKQRKKKYFDKRDLDRIIDKQKYIIDQGKA